MKIKMFDLKISDKKLKKNCTNQLIKYLTMDSFF